MSTVEHDGPAVEMRRHLAELGRLMEEQADQAALDQAVADARPARPARPGATVRCRRCHRRHGRREPCSTTPKERLA